MLTKTIAACTVLLLASPTLVGNQASAAELAVRKVAKKSAPAKPASNTGLVNKMRYGDQGVYRPSSPGGWR